MTIAPASPTAASRQSPRGEGSGGGARTRLRGQSLVLSRGVAAAVGLAAVALFAAGIPTRLAQLETPCAATACAPGQLTDVAAANQHLQKSVRRLTKAPHRALDEGLRGERGERRFLGRLPDHRVAADESESGIP